VASESLEEGSYVRSCLSRFALVLAAISALAALPGTASAWEYLVANGRPGPVSMPPVYPFEDGRFTTFGPYLMFTTFDGAYAYRSPASNGEQLVAGIYLVQRWNGSQWYVASRQNTPTYRIAPGQRGVYLPRLWRAPGGTPLYNRGEFRVQLLVAWSDSSGGLGNTVLTPNQVGDLRCQSMLRPCQATARWVRLGRTFATGGGW
jgi:hypothetical protein